MDKFTHIFENGSSPFDRAMNRAEIIVENHKIRVVLGDITPRSHAKSYICQLKRFSIRDTIACHSDQRTLLFDPRYEYKLIIRRRSSHNLQSALHIVKSFVVCEIDSHFLIFLIKLLCEMPNCLTEIISSDGNAFLIDIFLHNDTRIESHLFCSFNMITS